jgi:hypothetical protein
MLSKEAWDFLLGCTGCPAKSHRKFVFVIDGSQALSIPAPKKKPLGFDLYSAIMWVEREKKN